MSDTPRTDDEMVEMITGDGPVKTKTRWVHWTACATIERELAAANERIRRLEAAGNAMHHEMQFWEWRQGSRRAQANAARRAWLVEMGGRV